MSSKIAAKGVTSVVSSVRPECHAPSTFSVKDLSGSNGARDRVLAQMFAFWEAQGVARKGAEGWEVRDVVNGGAAWLPMSAAGMTGRADVAERSHVIASANGGAFCPCNVLPETGAVNAARGDENMTTLNASARALLAAWPMWWRENVARKASLARLA